MRYSFPDIHRNYPLVVQRAIMLGKLSKDNMWIELPNNFNFEDYTIPPQVIPNVLITTVPEEWPLLLKPLKLLAKNGEAGLGDIIERLIGVENSEAFKHWFKEYFKSDCGCLARKQWLNRKYPL